MAVDDRPSAAGPLVEPGTREPLAADLKLQILTTEHWSLLSTRSMSWNEAFSRAEMFLSVLSGGVLALALVASGTSFGDGFVTFALLLLPVVLFAGVGTFVRLTQVNREDTQWVIGMNRLRHAYLEAAPELRPYFVTASDDDEAGVMATVAAAAGPGGYRHALVTTPGLIAVIDGVVAAAIAATVSLRLGMDTALSAAAGVAAGVAMVALLTAYQYQVASPRAGTRARFPAHHAGVSVRNR